MLSLSLSFLHDETLTLLNEKILDAHYADSYVDGGECPGSVFKADKARGAPGSGGEPLLPVTTDAFGRSVVDMEPVRQEFARLEGLVNASSPSKELAAALRSLGSRLRTHNTHGKNDNKRKSRGRGGGGEVSGNGAIKSENQKLRETGTLLSLTLLSNT